MDSLVERLRRYRSIMRGGQPSICLEAADELTRLTAENERLWGLIAVTPENVERVAKAIREELGIDWPYAGFESLLDVATAALTALETP